MQHFIDHRIAKILMLLKLQSIVILYKIAKSVDDKYIAGVYKLID